MLYFEGFVNNNISIEYKILTNIILYICEKNHILKNQF